LREEKVENRKHVAMKFVRWSLSDSEVTGGLFRDLKAVMSN
jgi:hypothetical protein